MARRSTLRAKGTKNTKEGSVDRTMRAGIEARNFRGGVSVLVFSFFFGELKFKAFVSYFSYRSREGS